MDTEIDTTSNGFFDCSSHFYERKNLSIGVPFTSLVIVYFCNVCGSFSSLFHRIHSIRKRKKTFLFLFFFCFFSLKVFW